MWNLIRESLDTGEWIDLGPFGYGGIIRVIKVRHKGRSWQVQIEHYSGKLNTLRVGKTRVLDWAV